MPCLEVDCAFVRKRHVDGNSVENSSSGSREVERGTPRVHRQTTCDDVEGHVVCGHAATDGHIAGVEDIRSSLQRYSAANADVAAIATRTGSRCELSAAGSNATGGRRRGEIGKRDGLRDHAAG